MLVTISPWVICCHQAATPQTTNRPSRPIQAKYQRLPLRAKRAEPVTKEKMSLIMSYVA